MPTCALRPWATEIGLASRRRYELMLEKQRMRDNILALCARPNRAAI